MSISLLSLITAGITTYYFGCIPPVIFAHMQHCQPITEMAMGDDRSGQATPSSGGRSTKDTTDQIKAPSNTNNEAKDSTNSTNPPQGEQNPYSSAQNRLETQALDVQSLQERQYTLLREQLNRDNYLDPSFLR